MQTQVIKNAKLIWDYLASFNQMGSSDAIVVCCSYDLRIADYACELADKLQIPQIAFSGNSGNWTTDLWDVPEAQIFKERALAIGFNRARILTEVQATNIAENIAFSKKLLPEATAVTFITKPNTILRVKLTVPIQWPDITAYTSCPDWSFPEEVSNINGVFGVIHEMVGDIQRIIEYPVLGYQVDHELPEDVLAAYDFLVREGYTQHLIKRNQVFEYEE